MGEPDILRRRPLPSFDQWLTENGSGQRGDGFDAFIDVAERMLARTGNGLDEDSAAFLRITKGLFVAAAETCNLETAAGRPPEKTILHMARVMGCVAMYAVASVLEEDAHYRAIAKVLTEEFRFAAKESADQMNEARERVPSPAAGEER